MKKDRSFTLIELLIVISVIAVLIGMLLPALKAAQDKARSISCLNNLKTYGTNFMMYINDFNLAPAAQETDSSGNPVYWNEKIRFYTNTNIATAMKKGSVWFCPSFGQYTSHYYSRIGYGMNSVLPPGKKGDEFVLTRATHPDFSRVRQPTVTPLLADQFDDWHISSGAYIKDGALLYHNMNINTLFIDGHVSAHKKSYLIILVSTYFNANGTW